MEKSKYLLLLAALFAGCVTANGGSYPLSECRDEAVLATGIRPNSTTADMTAFDKIYRQCVLRPLEVTIRVVDSPTALPSAVTRTIDLPPAEAERASDLADEAREDAQRTMQEIRESLIAR